MDIYKSIRENQLREKIHIAKTLSILETKDDIQKSLNHKYFKKEMVNGKEKYYYTEEQYKKEKSNSDFKVGDKVKYLGQEAVVTAINESSSGKTTYSVKYKASNGGSTKAAFVSASTIEKEGVVGKDLGDDIHEINEDKKETLNEDKFLNDGETVFALMEASYRDDWEDAITESGYSKEQINFVKEFVKNNKLVSNFIEDDEGSEGKMNKWIKKQREKGFNIIDEPKNDSDYLQVVMYKPK